jgi:hypothetical protein
MPLIPYSFLVRVAYPCPYVPGIPLAGGEVVDLPEACRIDNLADLDDRSHFADVRLGWNESGLGLQVTVRGKEMPCVGDSAKPLLSDRVSLWVDTREARGSHRATRFCHQFHFLLAGAGPDRDEPVVVPMKINRALQDAPLAPAAAIPFRVGKVPSGYRIEAFLPASALNGFDPEQHPRLGFHYLVHDTELGEQSLNVPSQDFPVGEDPSLWSILELGQAQAAKAKGRKKRQG